MFPLSKQSFFKNMFDLRTEPSNVQRLVAVVKPHQQAGDMVDSVKVNMNVKHSQSITILLDREWRTDSTCSLKLVEAMTDLRARYRQVLIDKQKKNRSQSETEQLQQQLTKRWTNERELLTSESGKAVSKADAHDSNSADGSSRQFQLIIDAPDRPYPRHIVKSKSAEHLLNSRRGLRIKFALERIGYRNLLRC